MASTTIHSDPQLKQETNEATNKALHNAAEKAGEIKQRIDQTTENAQIQLGNAAQRASEKSNEIKNQLNNKADDIKERVTEEKRDLRNSFEKGKTNVKQERALSGDQTAVDPNIAGLSVLEKAQLASDEVFRAAGETPIPTDENGGLLETAAVLVSNTVDLAKQAAAKTAETASSAAAHISQALEGVPRRVDLTELEQKRAQEKVNDLKAEHQEMQDQADKKRAELHAEVKVNQAQGNNVKEPQTVSLTEASSQSITGTLKAVGQKVADAVEVVRDTVTNNTTNTTTTGADEIRAT